MKRVNIPRPVEQASAGAYLCVIAPGPVQRGDSITVVHRTEHDVTIGRVFHALTREPLLLERCWRQTPPAAISRLRATGSTRRGGPPHASADASRYRPVPPRIFLSSPKNRSISSALV